MHYVYQSGYPYYPVYHTGTRYPQSYRQVQPVNPDIFNQSAIESKPLMKDVATVLDKLSTSKEFDSQLMNAAQSSNAEEVKRLIYSLGITSEVDIHFNPDGIRLTFISGGCNLTVNLRWR